jgi:hypothetical protein
MGSVSSSEEISMISSGMTAGRRERDLTFSFLFLGCFFVVVVEESGSEDEDGTISGVVVLVLLVTVRF